MNVFKMAMLYYILTVTTAFQNVTRLSIIDRIKQVNDVSDLFKNIHGTCGANTLFFLKIIDLREFEYLTESINSNAKILSLNEMKGYIGKQTEWKYVQGNRENHDTDFDIYDFINRILRAFQKIKDTHSYNYGNHFITIMNYPVKNKKHYHSVILWLTNEDELILIDPQKFYKKDILLYTNRYNKMDNYILNDKTLKTESLFCYVKENIDFTNEWRDSEILSSKYEVIEDVYNKDVLTRRNNKIKTIIANRFYSGASTYSKSIL
jgi:hypothetical protein